MASRRLQVPTNQGSGHYVSSILHPHSPLRPSWSLFSLSLQCSQISCLPPLHDHCSLFRLAFPYCYWPHNWSMSPFLTPSPMIHPPQWHQRDLPQRIWPHFSPVWTYQCLFSMEKNVQYPYVIWKALQNRMLVCVFSLIFLPCPVSSLMIFCKVVSQQIICSLFSPHKIHIPFLFLINYLF